MVRLITTIQHRNFGELSVYFYGSRKGQVKFSTSEAGADLLLDDDLLRIFDYFVLYGKRLAVKIFDLEERKNVNFPS